MYWFILLWWTPCVKNSPMRVQWIIFDNTKQKYNNQQKNIDEIKKRWPSTPKFKKRTSCVRVGYRYILLLRTSMYVWLLIKIRYVRLCRNTAWCYCDFWNMRSQIMMSSLRRRKMSPQLQHHLLITDISFPDYCRFLVIFHMKSKKGMYDSPRMDIGMRRMTQYWFSHGTNIMASWRLLRKMPRRKWDITDVFHMEQLLGRTSMNKNKVDGPIIHKTRMSRSNKKLIWIMAWGGTELSMRHDNFSSNQQVRKLRSYARERLYDSRYGYEARMKGSQYATTYNTGTSYHNTST